MESLPKEVVESEILGRCVEYAPALRAVCCLWRQMPTLGQGAQGAGLSFLASQGHLSLINWVREQRGELAVEQLTTMLEVAAEFGQVGTLIAMKAWGADCGLAAFGRAERKGKGRAARVVFSFLSARDQREIEEDYIGGLDRANMKRQFWTEEQYEFWTGTSPREAMPDLDSDDLSSSAPRVGRADSLVIPATQARKLKARPETIHRWRSPRLPMSARVKKQGGQGVQGGPAEQRSQGQVAGRGKIKDDIVKAIAYRASIACILVRALNASGKTLIGLGPPTFSVALGVVTEYQDYKVWPLGDPLPPGWWRADPEVLREDPRASIRVLRSLLPS